MANGNRTVLFLCTGNYYRSRHAEAVFNHLAAGADLLWRAASRGLAIKLGVNNVGSMALATVARLGVLAIPHEPYLRMPAGVTAEDVSAADLVVALKEAEHRPLMRERHPEWAGRAEYWAVHDVDCAPPEAALPEIEGRVRELIARLTGQNDTDRIVGPTASRQVRFHARARLAAGDLPPHATACTLTG